MKTLIKAFHAGALGRIAAQQILGLKSQANFRECYLEPVLEAKLIEMTMPNSPNSPTQKYKLTEKWKSTLAKLKDYFLPFPSK